MASSSASPSGQPARPADRLQVRPYAESDRDAVYDICVRTAHDDDHSRTDPDLETIPLIFAGPYVALEPELALVLVDGFTVVGYILGTADTERFVAAYRERWLPQLAEEFPPLAGPPTTAAERLVSLLHSPEFMLRPELQAYPAHLHIDILRDHQRLGGGHQLMSAFLGLLRSRDIPAVHLGVGESNVKARKFYQKAGFHPIGAPTDGTVYLGRSTAS